MVNTHGYVLSRAPLATANLMDQEFHPPARTGD